jgi:hypothetical protein
MVSNGLPLRWVDSTGARGLAMSLSRIATPGTPLELRVSAGRRGALVVRDAGGVLDSARTDAATASWQLRTSTPPLQVESGSSIATVALPDPGAVRRVLVLGEPGWEGKFVVAALEELGWAVDGSLRVSPSGTVTIGVPRRPDGSRYAAVVVVDSMAVDAAALSAFVTGGGGLVLGGDALRIPALAALRPARGGELRGAVAGGLLTDAPRRGLDAWELDLMPDAVVLAEDAGEHTHREPALIARRNGRGRVVAMPYRETWRWRMQGSDDGAEEHRRWWDVALAAAVPAEPDAGRARAQADALPGSAAPYADLVARLGPPQAADVAAVPPRRAPDDERGTWGDIPLVPMPRTLLLITLLALVAEWGSRRLHGRR